jgi:integrase
MPNRAKGLRLRLREREGRPAVYVICDGDKEISTGCGPSDLRGANERLARYAAETFRPDRKQRDLAQVRVEDVIVLYLRDYAPTTNSVKTLGYHGKALLPFWGDKTLDDVKGSTCRQYLSSRSGPTGSQSTGSTWTAGSARTIKSTVKPSTVRRELKTLQAAINYWHKESPLEAVPKVSLPPEGERRERVLSREEAAQLLWACRRRKAKHVARAIIIGLYTGTRIGAILRLRWTPSLDSGFVDMGRRICYRRGSAERETSKRRPPVQIPWRLFHHLSRWQRADSAIGSPRIISFRGAEVLKLKRAWAGVVKEAGLGKDVTPHVLRHTAATWALWEGKTIWEVAGIIGADASTVDRVYGHHRLSVEERARA